MFVVKPKFGVRICDGVIDPDAQAANYHTASVLNYYPLIWTLHREISHSKYLRLHDVAVHPHSGSEQFVLCAEFDPLVIIDNPPRVDQLSLVRALVTENPKLISSIDPVSPFLQSLANLTIVGRSYTVALGCIRRCY